MIMPPCGYSRNELFTMDELKGLAVLSIGPVAIFALLIGSIIVFTFVIRNIEAGRKRWFGGGVAALIIVLFPTWDVIAGHIRFHKLCVSETGPQIYRRVVLDPTYRDVQVPDASYRYMDLPLARRYPHKFEEKRLPGPGRIRLARGAIRDAESGELIATYTGFFYGGGWFENTFSLAGAGGGHCGFGFNAGDFRAFLEAIFIRSDAK
jgi:hypothetical protein